MKVLRKPTISLLQQTISLIGGKSYASFFVFFFLFAIQLNVSGYPNFLLFEIDNSTIVEESSIPNKQYTAGEDTTIVVNVSKLEQIIIQSEQLRLDDKKQSEALILGAFEIMKQETVSDSLLARIYDVIGKLLIDRRQYNAGIDSLLKSVALRKNVFGEMHLKLADTYNYLGIGYIYLRQYEKAMDYFDQSVYLLNENQVVNFSLYDANLNMGIAKANKGQFEQSYKCFNNALLVLDSIGSSVDSMRVAGFYVNYGLTATLMGEFDKADQYYSTAESIYKIKKGNYFVGVANVMINKGINAYYKYDYTKAELYYKEALSIYLKTDEKSIAVPRTYNNLSALSIKTGDYASSIQYSLSGLKYNPDGYLKILFFQNLADSYASLGKIDKAEYYYSKAIELLSLARINPTKSISLYRSYADFLFDIKKYKESKANYDIALEKSILYNTSNSEVYASLLSQIGDFYRYSEIDIDSSILYYNDAIEVWNGIFDKQDTVKSRNFNDIRFLDAFFGKAQSLSIQYHETSNLDLLRGGLEIYKWALDRAGKISGNLDRENQLLLNEKFKSAYEEAIDIAYILYKNTSDEQYRELAFEFGERLKSSVLLAAVQNISALRTTDVPEQIVQSELQLQQEVNGMKKLLLTEKMKAHPNSKRIDFFNSRLLQIVIKYDSLVAQIEQHYPRYFALKYDRSVISAVELTEQLQSDEVILEYVLTDSVLTLFSFGEDLHHFSQHKLDTTFHNALDHLINIKNVDIAQNNRNNMVEFVHDANILWDYLLKPVYPKLSGKKLIIVPDGILGYLSFDLLLSSPEIPDELNYGLLPYLFKEFPVSYAYSSSLRFNKYFKRKTIQQGELIAFAPDYKFGQDTRYSGLSLLPNSASEALEVTKIFNGEAFLEEDATKSRFLKEASNYKVIHLAMHTIINDSLPMLSELLFYGDSSMSSDSKMQTYEVFGLNLSADLVVLSACNTGYGRLHKGEGIMSLARGFIYAGVPSIVITLWEVQDKATAGIMKQFYTYLKDGDRKDVALQKAKLDFLVTANQLKSHPYYWSSFLITGDAQQIVEAQKDINNTRSIFFGILLLVLLSGGAIFWKKKERKIT